jgi:hypothetical protein
MDIMLENQENLTCNKFLLIKSCIFSKIHYFVVYSLYNLNTPTNQLKITSQSSIFIHSCMPRN